MSGTELHDLFDRAVADEPAFTATPGDALRDGRRLRVRRRRVALTAAGGALAVAVLVPAAIVVAGSGTGGPRRDSGQTSGPGSSSDLPASAAGWDRFPAGASPRPIVLAGSDVIDGYVDSSPNENDKAAWGNRVLRLDTTLPTGPSTDRGYALRSAANAWEALLSGGGSSAGLTPLRVVSVRLGSAPFETDRGTQTLPAWLFETADGRGTGAVLALADGAVFRSPNGPYHPALALAGPVDSPDTTLTVRFAGSPPGGPPCGRDFTGRAYETDHVVAVEIDPVPWSSTPTTEIACPAVGYGRTVTVHLDRPVGTRVVVPVGGGLPQAESVSGS
jgi:hypothetical protein